ncbi:potassium channel, voltage-dependent transporter [Niveomyces insectorum RCEF 264]|uniref:Potassium channel, voltage-dependent transporter n=1 Tax=Niveomyces insectorum RCEF 264 TaxID=1081102 RepID=A0A167WXR1_9HYPO|nr:potassium channel, voltage-dependent transporter [Niveomyces insectorum RCEF 264]
MEKTFITIHNLSPDANILFASASIEDILDHKPADVQGKSCFDYFHPAEVPFARGVHSRGLLLDKAAVLHYCRLRSGDGTWVSCECCFTVVHDVLVACTSVYERNAKSERRAIEAPQIRRMFSCSPRDPRYHMLEHLSPKFKMSPTGREPRAALILNRFTRNLTVMFATNAISKVVGLRPDQIKGQSFYRCIQENCLSEAIKCLESAKANDSIAYLRFCFQDPREDDELGAGNGDNYADGGGDNDGSGNGLDGREGIKVEADQTRCDQDRQYDPMDMDVDLKHEVDPEVRIKMEEDDKAHLMPNAYLPSPRRTRLASYRASGSEQQSSRQPTIELEAVVSCTSDGLVVVLRKARPPIPPAHPPLVAFDYGNGLFAAPWAQHPIQPNFPVESLHTFRPPYRPQYMPLRDNVKEAGGPPTEVLMGSIRDVAVFAWGVVGIHPRMAANFGHSKEIVAPIATMQQQQHQDQPQQRRASWAESGGILASGSNDVLGSPRAFSTRRDKGKAPAIRTPLSRPYAHTPEDGSSEDGWRAYAPVSSSSGSCNPHPAWPGAGPGSVGKNAGSSQRTSLEYLQSGGSNCMGRAHALSPA